MITKIVHRHFARRVVFVLQTLLIVSLLAGCDDADWDLLASAGEDWAESNDIWDGENVDMGNLARLGVQQQIDTIISGPPPELAGASIVNDIREADRLASAGALQGGQTGLASIEEAISLRPNDWSYWEQKGALLLAMGESQDALDAFAQSTELVRQHVIDGGGDCKTYMRNLLTQREQALITQIEAEYQNERQPSDGLFNQLDTVQADLSRLDTPDGTCG